MSAPAQAPEPVQRRKPHEHPHLPSIPQALASLMQTIVVALFVLTFLLQPFLIPSESMERTLLVGDFLLFNKQIFAPAGRIASWFLPYRPVERGDIVVFHHTQPPMLIKRVVAVPGDRVRITDGHVIVNGVALDEPYAVFEPAPANSARDNFPAANYTDPEIDPEWWRQMQSLTRNGELVVPKDEYFVLGDNRNHSKDSRFWGFVPRQEIVARPLVIYFSLWRPSSTDVQQVAEVHSPQAPNDRLGHERDLAERLEGFARWRRIFRVVH
ncbi:MAG TPA: signal peptidase I [Terracidiphilus sp.]|nr:signal peptidase I [Terracidiphilus sp.]